MKSNEKKGAGGRNNLKNWKKEWKRTEAKARWKSQSREENRKHQKEGGNLKDLGGLGSQKPNRQAEEGKSSGRG